MTLFPLLLTVRKRDVPDTLEDNRRQIERRVACGVKSAERYMSCHPPRSPGIRWTVDAIHQSDYSDYMITNLREAKSHLSQLVQLAAEGEEIVITVRGRPMARLTSVSPKETQVGGRKEWADELLAAAEAARLGPRKSTSQQFWDELREERL
jgi:prevent-host-death family protein